MHAQNSPLLWGKPIRLAGGQTGRPPGRAGWRHDKPAASRPKQSASKQVPTPIGMNLLQICQTDGLA